MLKEKYFKKVIPAMKAKFGYKNDLAVPKLDKIVVNVGLSRSLTEKNPKYIEQVEKTLMEITGQRPVKNLSHKSIAGFKIREGMTVGMSVTLRKNRMYDFMEKLIAVVFPRMKDFRGIKQNIVDNNGNLSIGFKEQIVFPEIKIEEIQIGHPLEVTIVTTAKKREEGLELFKLLGFPFKF